ncbi:hypothetical protein L602_000100001260 [Cupriavidus gilardii J11]|uniref:DUF2782 domain-containing protein n=1 Tax=Cupriavidus gilardii J11 TaxID=936133 RepID=A0A562BVA0_9BURK|nr:hypothetical protein [Cupriavidus gilardii]TWG89236.1 hypothetical protein L602_000100001260 [Cupriavidus gilardii J11]
MTSHSYPAARADEPDPLPGTPTRALLAAAAVVALTVSPWALAQQAAEDNGALTQQELNEINNQPIAPAQRTQLNHPREPSFQLTEPDGTQVREYRDRRGQQADIEVRSGAGTQYQMSRPEDSSPRIRDREVNRVPSVRVLQF